MVFLSDKQSSRRQSSWLRLLLRLLIPASASYRPELYYMRGPGPKYREKHKSAFDRALPGKTK